MRIIKAQAIIEDELNGSDILKKIEKIGRVCYKSEDKITDESAPRFVAGIIKSGHESVIEHFSLSVRFICDRGVSHEICRHRICSLSQESTRYVCYNGSSESREVGFIKPYFWKEDSDEYETWICAMRAAENYYHTLLNAGCQAQQARSVLPNSLKTELVMTANLREWRHFFKLRAAKAAHPQMREITVPLLKELKEILPVIFDDIIPYEE